MLFSRSRFLAFAFALRLVLSSPSEDCAFKVKESVQPPRGWVRQKPAPLDHKIELRIGLPQPNFHVLEQHLYEVSDPYHERYGAHLSKAEVDELVAPHPESLALVDKWLDSHEIPESDRARSPAKDWVIITIPVRLAEQMLNTTYHVWKHTKNGEHLVRTTAFSLPQDIHEHVEVIQPTTMFALWNGMKSGLFFEALTQDKTGLEALPPIIDVASGTTVDASCNTTITITCIQQLYNAVGYEPQAAQENGIGITAYLEQFANIQDLQSFYADQRPDALNTAFTFISVKGGLNSQNQSLTGIEANLDVQFAYGLSFPTPGTFWSTAGRPPFIPDLGTPNNTNEPYTDWLGFVLSHPNPPPVISTSYGDNEQAVPQSFALRACKGFAQLAARGVSLLFSSGDGGVGDGDPDPETQQCLTNDGHNVTRFILTFPATCPFVTSVGGTNQVPEEAASFSGGGFSDYFWRPSYQEEAVDNYLRKLPQGTYKDLFNSDGRAVPDVAAQGRHFRIFVAGNPVTVSGTSASSPTFAGIVALLNDARLAQGKPPLGFLNPLLYSIGVNGLNDITVGNNPGCGTPGFNATKGWDPVTGLGTPNFGKLKDFVAAGH